MLKIHFMGISGSGESAVAALAKANGYVISGCDAANNGHSKSHINEIDLLCVSPSVFYLNKNHEEIVAARQKNIPVMTWQEFMGKKLFKDKFVVAVAGTHGKTTTTGLAGFLLEEADFDPWVEVGGVVKNWNSNYRISHNNSKYFVCEADEFFENFLNISADIIVLNNIEFDHPEFFKTETKMYESYMKFINNSKPNSKLIINSDSRGIEKLLDGWILKKRQDVEIQKINNGYIQNNNEIFSHLQIFGNQNISNAAGVLKLSELLGISVKNVKEAFQKFSGIKRRQDLIGEINGIKIYDDYAHHPTAISETINAFKSKYPSEKITVVIEPHTYSRMKYLFKDFLTCVKSADNVIFTDIFASREAGNETITSSFLVEKINKPNTKYVSFDKITEWLKKNVTKGIIIFMGAGNINKASKHYIDTLKSSTNTN